ncbi:hypothetical protein [Photobacterium lutimaris]|uniref:hypothetical protein n=1 Tax=Photobacterium lutimaris TaxID=388278 RepID=UPI001414FF45|nr:hypothetical protein [Photobacterium lutimaris]
MGEASPLAVVTTAKPVAVAATWGQQGLAPQLSELVKACLNKAPDIQVMLQS